MPDDLPASDDVIEDADSDWEYEYHETETETFYVTLDLSSLSSYHRPKRKDDIPAANTTPATLTSAADGSARNANDGAGRSRAAAEPIPEMDSVAPAVSGDKQAEMPARAEDRIQILDFHTPNPIVSYQNQIYSCEWTTAIGTDLLLARPDLDNSYPVLRAAPGVSVIAATNIKLSGRPVQLDSQNSTIPGTEKEGRTPVLENASQLNEAQGANQPTSIEIPTGLAPNRARQNQANFLQRLIDVKAAKGEKDEVTVHIQRTNQGSGWRVQQRALAQQRLSETGGDGDVQEVASRTPPGRRGGTVGRPRRGAWRTSGSRTSKGGLFRDYRPQLWESEGADTATNSTQTPERWEQLVGDSSRGSSTAGIIASSSTAQTEQPQGEIAGNPIDTPQDVPSSSPQAGRFRQAHVSDPMDTSLAAHGSNPPVGEIQDVAGGNTLSAPDAFGFAPPELQAQHVADNSFLPTALASRSPSQQLQLGKEDGERQSRAAAHENVTGNEEAGEDVEMEDA